MTDLLQSKVFIGNFALRQVHVRHRHRAAWPHTVDVKVITVHHWRETRARPTPWATWPHHGVRVHRVAGPVWPRAHGTRTGVGGHGRALRHHLRVLLVHPAGNVLHAAAADRYAIAGPHHTRPHTVRAHGWHPGGPRFGWKVRVGVAWRQAWPTWAHLPLLGSLKHQTTLFTITFTRK